jgi:hypothetical protein
VRALLERLEAVLSQNEDLEPEALSLCLAKVEDAVEGAR